MNILIAHFCTHWVQCSGGVEKVVCKFANEMLKRGHEVTVLYIDQKEGAPYFSLDHRVKTSNILYENRGGRKNYFGKASCQIARMQRVLETV